MKRVLLVGNCNPDNQSLSAMLNSNFQVEIQFSDSLEDSKNQVDTNSYDLVLVNRIFDKTGENGIELVQHAAADTSSNASPIMLITNFDEHQQAAIAEGAQPGFGKSQIGTDHPKDCMAKFLS